MLGHAPPPPADWVVKKPTGSGRKRDAAGIFKPMGRSRDLLVTDTLSPFLLILGPNTVAQLEKGGRLS
jgi:hypothetical protein